MKKFFAVLLALAVIVGLVSCDTDSALSFISGQLSNLGISANGETQEGTNGSGMPGSMGGAPGSMNGMPGDMNGMQGNFGFGGQAGAYTEFTGNTTNRDIISNSEDEVDNVNWTDVLYIDLSTMTASNESGDSEDFSSIEKKKNASQLIENVYVYMNDTEILVNAADHEGNLKVVLTGSEKEGYSFSVKPNTEYPVQLYLDNVSITSGNYPAIRVKEAVKTYVVLKGSNTLKDGRKFGTGYGDEYTDNSADVTDEIELTSNWAADGADSKGTLFSKGAILFSGNGSLSIEEGYKHGIYSKDYIRIFDGTYNIRSTGRNGIQSVNGFIMDGGSVTIKGTGTYTNNQSRGIIVEGQESEEYPGEGFIVIKDGTLDITTVSKGISAKWDVEDDAETSSQEDDPYPYVRILGGKINVATTGRPQEESANYVTFTDANGVSVSEKTKLSPEGIEGKAALFVEDGTLILETTDDCLNSSRSASAKVEISGGYIYAHSSNNDAIDSNGTIIISGGVVVAWTTTSPETAFDCDNYTFAVTGGLVAGIGTSGMISYPTSSACSQSTLVLSGSSMGSAGSVLAVEDASGNAVFAFRLPSGIGSASQLCLILSSPEIKTDTSYKVVSGATATGGDNFYGLYTDLPSASGGSETVSSLTVSSSGSSAYVYGGVSSGMGGFGMNGMNQGPVMNQGSSMEQGSGMQGGQMQQGNAMQNGSMQNGSQNMPGTSGSSMQGGPAGMGNRR